LRHLGIADVITMIVNTTTAVRATYPDPTFANGGKYGIAVAIAEELSAFAGSAEGLDGIFVLLRMGIRRLRFRIARRRRNRQGKEEGEKQIESVPHYENLPSKAQPS
jgi:hypothetical protein